MIVPRRQLHQPHLNVQGAFSGSFPERPANPMAPSREIHEVVRRALRDGRVLEWVYELKTHAALDFMYCTNVLVEAPTLDDGCVGRDPDDVVECHGCGRTACAHNDHGATCSGPCALTYCAGCLKPIVLHGARLLACETCADELTAGFVKKSVKAISRMIWG